MRTITHTLSLLKLSWKNLLPIFPKTKIRQTHGNMHAALTSVIRGRIFRADICISVSVLNLTLTILGGIKFHHVVCFPAIVLHVPGKIHYRGGKRLCKKHV